MRELKAPAVIRFDVRHQGRHKLAFAIAGQDYLPALDTRIAPGKRPEADRTWGGPLGQMDPRDEGSEEMLGHLDDLFIMQCPFGRFVSAAAPSEKSLDIVILLKRQFGRAGGGRSFRHGSDKVCKGRMFRFHNNIDVGSQSKIVDQDAELSAVFCRFLEWNIVAYEGTEVVDDQREA